MDRKRSQEGFSLPEMIVVIVITAIVGGMVAVFIRKPVEGYVDAARRAELSDTADTALRRIGRDLRLALPNSVRVTDAGRTVELLLTRTGGRYRAETAPSAPAGDVLDFTTVDTSFDQLGPLSAEPAQAITAGDQLVVFNLGIPGADAYVGDNRTSLSGTGAGDRPDEYKLSFAPKQFPLESPGARFHVVSGPVSYVCDLPNGILWRYWGYGIQAAQPNAAALAGGATRAQLASNLSDCLITYDPGVIARNGVVTLRLSLSKGGETVNLYHLVHVSNVP